MTARFNHKISLRGDVIVTIAVEGGGFTESYRADKAELRRFGWALLADLDPDEAAKASAECGVDIAALTGGPRPRPRADRTGTRRTPAHEGDDRHHMLAHLAAGGASPRTGLVRDLGWVASRVAYALRCLDAAGHAGRTNSGRQGVEAIWAITAAGRAELARLGDHITVQQGEPHHA